MTETRASFLSRLNLPLRVGLVFALIAMLLAVVGIFRGNIPLNPVSILLALLISGGSWGVVAWAVTTAVVDVEEDIMEEDMAEAGVSADTERGRDA